MRLADKFEATFALLLGKMEVKRSTIILRDMKKGQQQEVPFDGIVDHVIKLLGEKNLDTYTLRDQFAGATDD